MPTDGPGATDAGHGWIGTETIETRLGTFPFAGGYPAAGTAERLEADAPQLLTLTRAADVFLAQMPPVSWYGVWKGVAAAGPGAPNQLVLWETLMDAQTLLLTGNTDTVYGLGALDLRRDGPTVVEVPPRLLGGISDLWQREILGIGPIGADKGRGGKLLLLPPDHTGPVPDGYIAARSRTYRAVFGVRGFLVDGKPDQAVALMKAAKVYPLAAAAAPPAMTFVNGSGQPIDTIFADSERFFADLAEIVASEPADNLSPLERGQLAAIGIAPGVALPPGRRPHAPAGRGRPPRRRAGPGQFVRLQRSGTARLSRPRLGVGVRRRQRHLGRAGLRQHRPPGRVRLHRDRHVARDGRETRRRRLPVHLDPARRHRGLPRRGDALPPAAAARHPRQALLVGRRLRRAEPVAAAHRAALPHRQPVHRPGV